MTYTHRSCITTNPALLLIEPDTLSYSERAAQLDQAGFHITRADNTRDIYLMRNVFHFSVAILSDTIGCLALRASAQMVRGQWPKARILILGKAPIQLEDHLYDENIVDASSGRTLLAMLDKVTEDQRNQTSNALAGWLNHMSVGPRLQQERPLQESDPIKVSGPVMEADYIRDWPADEHLRRRNR